VPPPGMFMLFTTTLVPAKLSRVGSKVMVKDPITGSTGAPASKPTGGKVDDVGDRLGACQGTAQCRSTQRADERRADLRFHVCTPARQNAAAIASILRRGYLCQRLHYIWTIGRTRAELWRT
jgi:hypothetical protein